ncbi:MAG: hypothetical protein AB8B95_10915 [Pseudohongiellaceae bacterium]
MTIKRLLCCSVLACIFTAISLPRVAAADDYQVISSAEILIDSDISDIAEILGLADHQWQGFKLPYMLPGKPVDNLNDSETLWARIPLSLVVGYQPDAPNAIYIPRHSIRMSVFLDERGIGGSDSEVYGQPSSAWNQPLLLPLPTNIPSADYLYFKVEGGPSGPILSPIMIGNQLALQPIYDSRNFWQIQASQLAFGLCFVLGLFSFWLWSKRKQDNLYLKFSLMSFCWCIGNAFSFISFVPISMTLWLGLVHSSFDWSAFLLVSFTLEATAAKSKAPSRFLFWLAVVATFTHLLVPARYFLVSANLFNAVQTAVIIGVGILVIWNTRRRRESTSLWFGAAFIGMCGLIIHDFYVVFIGSDDVHIEASNLAHLSIPLITVAFYAHLITRFVGALNTSEKLNSELEDRVEISRQRLVQSYSENRQLELEQAVEAERSKIYRDLHDDVGSKLSSILHSSPQSQTKSLARGALESLRASIFRANYQETSLSVILGEIAEEAQVRINSAGLAFKVIQTVSIDAKLDANGAYHLVRIFREIISNILHHARASSVVVELGILGDNLHCSVVDDGVGVGENPALGSGVENINYRVQDLNGSVSLKDTGLGTLITFSIPLKSIAAASAVTG